MRCFSGSRAFILSSNISLYLAFTATPATGSSTCRPAPQPNGNTRRLFPWASRTTMASSGCLPPPKGCNNPSWRKCRDGVPVASTTGKLSCKAVRIDAEWACDQVRMSVCRFGEIFNSCGISGLRMPVIRLSISLHLSPNHWFRYVP